LLLYLMTTPLRASLLMLDTTTAFSPEHMTEKEIVEFHTDVVAVEKLSQLRLWGLNNERSIPDSVYYFRAFPTLGLFSPEPSSQPFFPLIPHCTE